MSLINENAAHIAVLDVPLSIFNVAQWQTGEITNAQDCLAEETPVALIYNGVSHAVMLATAQDLEDFALGFSLYDGILNSVSELYSVELKTQTNGIELHCEIASKCFSQLKERRRTLAGKTGCGLCGAESLTQAMRYPPILKVQGKYELGSITRSLRGLQMHQALQQKTGATHASAYVSPNGEVALLREDVGRHNALDKLIGALAKSTIDKKGFIVTTSRASFEMVQKTASAGVGMLVAVSAPTGLAVRVAEQCGLVLVGFARENRLVVYSHAEHILNE